jgi:hypothetical protein
MDDDATEAVVQDEAEPLRILPMDARSDHASVTFPAMRIVENRRSVPEVPTAAGRAV